MTPDPADAPVSLDVRRGNPTEDELAALLAVVSEAYTEESAQATAPASRARSRWRLSARAARATLSREAGWGGFSG
ncbi:acyl-CoA carboxylase subunit epsilon [Microbacterium sp. dk485]|uniref:acyl-CoA carboxylase subunit epsilon n=1 Tax=Microbacterium sp. dk485 TaxID=2560021 RepID=UPI0010731407|nr:acyl-CoA carboxylase subunit epsilon [Microbacterium sp. dk485]TFV83815.1 acyl-CoA carboxylase subunit epsilon [Microbacterium sp. dk485]